jgi:AcrR family transcriptional regulator
VWTGTVMKSVGRCVKLFFYGGNLCRWSIASFSAIIKTTSKELAQAAGVAEGLLYHYFRSKEELLIAVVDRHGFLPQLLRLLSPPQARPAHEMLLAITTAFSTLLTEPVAYSAYSRAADLGPGVAWYATLGEGAAIAAAVQGRELSSTVPLYVAAGLAVLHSLVTTQAAPTLFSQRKVSTDEEALSRVFNRFVRWQTLRATLQMLSFATMLWAVTAGAIT